MEDAPNADERVKSNADPDYPLGGGGGRAAAPPTLPASIDLLAGSAHALRMYVTTRGTARAAALAKTSGEKCVGEYARWCKWSSNLAVKTLRSGSAQAF